MDLTRRVLIGVPLLWGASGGLNAAAAAAAANRGAETGQALCHAGTRRPERNSEPRSLESVLQERVSLLDWIPAQLHAAIAERRTTGDLSAYIQNAFDEAPLGCDLVFPPGLLQVQAPLTLSRYVNLVGQHTSLRARFADYEQDLLTIAIADSENRDARNLRISGFKALTFDEGGRNTLRIATDGGNVANMGFVIIQNVIETLDASPGYAIWLEGVGTHFNCIEHNSIRNGIYLACADGTVISRNVIYGVRTAVTLDLVPGAFRTAITHNAMVARDGALRVLRGTQWSFRENQVEQYLSEGPNRSSHRASVTIIGSAEPNVCRHGLIVNNHFGGGSNVDRSIALVSACEDLVVDGNVFNACTMSESSADLTIHDDSVRWTRFGAENMARGWRGGIRTDESGRATSNASNPRDLLTIQDAGTGSYGVWKDASVLGLRSGWAAEPTFRLRKTGEDLLVFEGSLRAGSAAAGTVVGTLPVGFRPARTAFLQAFDPIANAPCWFEISAGGRLTVRHVGEGARPEFSAAIVPVKGREGYTPGL